MEVAVEVEERVAVPLSSGGRGAPVGAGRAPLDAREQTVDEAQIVAALDAHTRGE